MSIQTAPPEDTPTLEREYRAARRFYQKKRWRLIFAAGLGLFVILNVIACMQARAMTHYVAQGERTPRPERLTRWQKAKVLLTGVTMPRPENGRLPSHAGLAYETIMIPAGGDEALEAWRIPLPAERGEPRGTVLMFPGYSAVKQWLIDDAARLRAMGFETWLVDFRGSGGSSGDVTTIGLSEGADVACAAAYVRALTPGRPLIAYGRSMGSAAILTAAARHAFRPDAAILECPFDTLLNTVNNRFELMSVPAFPLARLLVFWGGVQNRNWAFGNRPMDFARALEAPTLMLNGAQDRNAKPEDVRRVFDNLPGPRQHIVFEDCGHRAMSRCDEALWIESVRGFLDQYIGTS